MLIWIDAQLSPALCGWLEERFALDARHVRDLNSVEDSDMEIFRAAKEAGAVVMTKDRDFADLVRQHGAPPQILWVRSGNTSNRRMAEILEVTFEPAFRLLEKGESMIEIKG